MASRNISIRLALENQQQVTRGLDQVGTQGQAALKKVSDASAPASKGLLALNDASRSVRGEMESLTGRLGPLGSALSALGIGGVAAGAALAGLGVGLKAALAAAAEAEKVELRLGAVLKATGNAAGLTKAQLIDYANSLQGSLKINDETLKESIAVLATFRAVSGDTFKTGINLAADLAAVFGGDLLSATRQIGLAFQDPAAGMTALRRAGVTFTETQKDMIKSLQESGDLLGAQGIIVAELTQQVGGAAQAEGGGLAGATRGLANEWDDLLEAIGRTEAVMGPALFIVEKISSAIRGLASLSPTIDQKIVDLNKQVLAEDNNIARLTRGGVSGVAIKPHQDRKLALEQELDALIKIARAESDAEGAAQSRAQVAAIASRAGIALEASGQQLKKEGEKAAKEAATAAKKAEADRIAGLKEEANWLFRVTDLIEKDVKAWEKKNAQLPEYIAGLEQQQRLAGLTAEAREEELAVIKAAELAVHGLSEADEARIRSIVRATNAQEAGIEAAKKAAEESARAWEKATDRLKDSITDSIFRGFEEGESAGKLFFDTLRRAALTAAIQIPVNFLVDQGAGLLRGALGGGGSGALGTAANGASLANFFSGGSIGASISSGLFGTASGFANAGALTGAGAFTNAGMLTGGANGATSGLLGSGGFSGAFGGALPYIGAGVAALGILKGLGVIGGGRSVGPNAGAQLIEQGGVFAVGPSGADNGGNTAGVIAEVGQAVEVLNALAQGIGVAQIGDGIASFIDTFKAGGIGNAADLIKDAISKGVIEGLTEAERALISSSSDIGATASRIIENRLFPGMIADRLKQLKDPSGFQLEQLQKEEDALIAQAQTLGEGMEKTIADIREIFSLSRSKIGGGLDGIARDWNAVGDAASNAAREAQAANDNFNTMATAINSIASASEAAIAGLQATADTLKAFITGLDSGPLSALNIDQQYNAARAAFGANANPETARTLLELSKQRDPGIGFARDSARIRQQFGNTIAATPGLIAGEQLRASAAIQRERDAPQIAAAQQTYSALLASGDKAALDVFLGWLDTGLDGTFRPGLRDVVGFANGGFHPGGLRVVGERGPELEFTGPSRIFSNQQSAAMLDNRAVVSELREVKSRLENLDAALVSIAVRTVDMEARQRKWDVTGLLTRTA